VAGEDDLAAAGGAGVEVGAVGDVRFGQGAVVVRRRIVGDFGLCRAVGLRIAELPFGAAALADEGPRTRVEGALTAAFATAQPVLVRGEPLHQSDDARAERISSRT
jgi:hypothetical protein